MTTQSCRQIRNNTTEKDEFYPRYINKIKLISLIIIQYIYSNDRNENFILFLFCCQRLNIVAKRVAIFENGNTP